MADNSVVPPGFQIDSQQPAPPTDPTAVPPGFVLADQNGHPEASLGSVYRSGMSAVNRGIADIAGFPVDAETWLLNKIPGVNIQDPLLGSASIRRGMNAIGIDTEIRPQNTWERAASVAGSAVPDTLAMLGGAGVAKTLPKIGEALAPYAERFLPKTLHEGLGLGAATTAGAGAGQVAQEQLPEGSPYRAPLATLTNIATGMGVGGLQAGASKLAELAALPLKSYLRPMNLGRLITPTENVGGINATQGQQQMAASRLRSLATDPENLAANINPTEIVPGSQPSLGQSITPPDPGILAAERAVQGSPGFKQLENEQNAAQLAFLRGQRPEGATAGRAGAFLRQQLADIDSAGEQAIAGAGQRVRTAAEGVGGERFDTAHEYGETMRGNMSALNLGAKARESALWKALPNDLGIDPRPLGFAAQGIANNVSPEGMPITGDEARIFNKVTAYSGRNDALPFKDARALRSDISAAIDARRTAVGQKTEDPVVMRLTQLKSRVDDALAGRLDEVDQQQQAAVQAGQLSPEETLQATLQGWSDAYMSKRYGSTAGPGSGRTGVGRGARGPAGAAPGAIPAAGTPGGQSPGAAGAQSVPGGQGGLRTTSGAPIPQDVLDQYEAARLATQQRYATYRKGAVGKVLAPGQEQGYRIGAGAVPAKFWKAGDQGAEAVQAYDRAGGDPETLADYAGFSLRSAGGVRPDGTVDPGRLANWQRRFSSALSEMPPEVQARFQNAATAQTALDNASAAHANALRDFQTSVAAKFLGEDPKLAIEKALRSGDPTVNFRLLMQRTAGQPDVQDSLRRDFVDYMLDNLTSHGTTQGPLMRRESYQDFVDEYAGAMRELFGSDANFRRIAEDLRRTNLSIASKIKGASNTRQDIEEQARVAGEPQGFAGHVVSKATGHITSTLLGWLAGGPAGAAVGAASAGTAKVALSAHAAGLERVRDLVREALIHPEIAQTLLSQMSGPPPPYILDRLARQLRAITAVGTTEETKGRGYADGGDVNRQRTGRIELPQPIDLSTIGASIPSSTQPRRTFGSFAG